MATLTVGTGKQYTTIAAAVAAAKDGDVVAVAAGTYLNDAATLRRKITLTATGGQVTLLATTPLASGGALLTVTADATIDGFVVAGAHAADGTAAGILVQGASLILRNSLVTANDTGLSAIAGSTGTVTVAGSELSANGTGDAFGRNVSVGAVKALIIQDSYIHDARGGAEVRSLAAATTITGTRIIDGTAASGAGVELPNGGAAAIRASTIESGANATGPAIRYGGGTLQAGSSLSVTGTVLVADRAGATLLQNLAPTVTASLSADTVYGYATLATGPAVLSANTVPATRPDVSAAALVTPTLPLPVEYGRAGAVTSSGTVLTVGPGAYPTLAAALAAAQDGDTIDLPAGTYAIDPLTLTKALILQGTGGMARLTAASAPQDGGALLTSTASLTLRNIVISGVAAPGGVAAALHGTGGSLTLVNSLIQDSQIGILADPPTATLALYDTELARNGLADGRGGNLLAGSIGTLTLRNVWVHDALAGPEVRSTAANTVIDASRIGQPHGNGTADVLLPNGGRVSITGSVLQKGAASQPGALVQVGGGAVAAGTTVSIAGSTLIDDQSATTPLVTATAGTLTVTGTGFQGAAAGTTLVSGGSNTGAATKTGLAVSTAAPWGEAGAPAAAALTAAAPPATAGFGTLVLHVSQDAYHGNAKFSVTIDGVAAGGPLVATAAHAAGESQTVTVAGTFADGPHAVAVQYLNDLGARTLYIDGMAFDGQETGQTAMLAANGTVLLATEAVARPTPIALSLLEITAQGDALAFIAIDGAIQGGPLAVTASHAAGATQPMQLLLDLAPGAHTASVTLLNASATRSLYLDSLSVGGSLVPGASGTVAGTATVAFTVAPPAAANTNLFATVCAPQAWTPFSP